jgi:hypothetical protein
MTAWFESFVFGAANSLHCACMCGPLAFACQGGAKGACSYQLGRLASYGAVGVVLGIAGSVLGSAELGTPTAWVAFVFAAGIAALLLLGQRGSLAIPGLTRLLSSAMARTRRFSPSVRSALLGVFTPLLPCGLLWAAAAGAAIAGSALAGGAVMLGFALGTLPLLLLAQTQAGRLAARLGPNTLSWLQRGAMLAAAVTLLVRGFQGLNGGSCCH